jgi:hypothetical protein
MTLRLGPWLAGLTIKTKGLDMRRLDIDRVDTMPDGELGDFGWAQRPFIARVEEEYNAGRPLRFIVLKARQVGISTATEALLFLWSFFYRGSNSLVISYEDPQAQELFQMMKTYWDTWPHRHLYTLQYSTKRQMRWLETKSQVRVATAKNVGGSRGSTVHALHASELAFWADPETLWIGLNQTIPSRHGTLVVLESTANGIGNWFHEKWVEADAGESEFIPIFFPYYRHYEYRMHTTLSTRSELNADERLLLKLMQSEGASDEQAYRTVAWRRWAIINKCNGDLPYFMQEYPACVTGDTRVGTSRGLVRIDMVSPGDEATLGTVIRSHEQPASLIWSLTTTDGYRLRGTFDHPVFLETGLLQPLSTLKVGQKIRLQPSRLADSYHTVTWRELGVDHSLTITEEWGRLLGYYMGDGSYGLDTLSVACDAKDGDVVDDVVKLFDAVLGLQGRVRRTGSNKGGIEVRAGSKDLKPVLDRLGLLRRNSDGRILRKVHVPEVIWRSPPSVVREFLRGLFEADGFNAYNSPRIVFFSKHLEFLGDVQLLLLALGVTCRRVSRPAQTGTGYEYQANELCLNGDRVRAFVDRIGFVSERKHRRHQTKPRGRPSTPNTFVTEVTAVAADGVEVTYDLTVAGGEAFDANGILTHNTPDEAFIATGRPIFPHQKVRDAYTKRTGATGRIFRNGVGKVVFEADPSGPLTMFVRPNRADRREDRYFIGGDPSETVTGDPGCMHVLNRQTYEQVAVWHDRVNPVYFAEQMILLGDLYNHCMICPEVEGGGQAAMGYITKSNYDNVWRDRRPDRMRSGNVFGWSTNQTRKQWAIGVLQKRFLDGSLVIHDPKTYNQLISFVEHDDGYWGNSNPKIHDDAVMALAITVCASEEQGPFQTHRPSVNNPIVDLYNTLDDQPDSFENLYSTAEGM